MTRNREARAQFARMKRSEAAELDSDVRRGIIDLIDVYGYSTRDIEDLVESAILEAREGNEA